ncbi:MAG: FG-GAP repeat protein [Segetibacter sp.]
MGLAVADFNNDGWDDIYVGNDFHENDYYYINNGITPLHQKRNHPLPFSKGEGARRADEVEGRGEVTFTESGAETFQTL